MSWPREMRPTPIAPITTRFDGAFWPKTVEGTIIGAAMAAVFRTVRLETIVSLPKNFVIPAKAGTHLLRAPSVPLPWIEALPGDGPPLSRG